MIASSVDALINVFIRQPDVRVTVNIDVDSAGAILTESRAMVTAGGDRAVQQDDVTTSATFQASVQPCWQARALEVHYGRTALVAEAHRS